MTLKTVTIVLPDGYDTAEEFAKDCGFELAGLSLPLVWDAYSNRSFEPVEKRAAEIYATFVYDGPGTKPDWTPGGNGTKQDEARVIAREEIRASYTQSPEENADG